MAYQLDIQENALGSFNEALAKYREGEAGKLSAYKFAILHMAHFLELVLKMYVQTLDENLVYAANFRLLEKDAKAAGEDLLQHLLKRQAEDKHFPQPAGSAPAKTLFVADALALSKLERCKVSGVPFVDQEFIEDIEWLKGLRNSIEHFHFELEPRDVRLCLGRIVRRAQEFADNFSLFGLAAQVSGENAELFEKLADEYEHRRREANLEVEESRFEAFRGVRYKFHDQVDWNVFECPECRENTMIPEGRLTRATGARFVETRTTTAFLSNVIAVSRSFRRMKWNDGNSGQMNMNGVVTIARAIVRLIVIAAR